MKLYDIPREIEIFEDRLINAGGELTPELEAEWSNFISQGKDKLESAAFVISRFEDDIETCEAEVKRLRARAAAGCRNVDRLKGLTLYALKAMGGKVKTALVSLWIGRTGTKTLVDVREGVDLSVVAKTNPDLVRVKYEPNLDAIKAAYSEIFEQLEKEKETEYLQVEGEITPAVDSAINIRLIERRGELLQAANLPDCFIIRRENPTEYLRIS